MTQKYDYKGSTHHFKKRDEPGIGEVVGGLLLMLAVIGGLVAIFG